MQVSRLKRDGSSRREQRKFMIGYLDPGTGTIIFQAIVAGGAALFAAVRYFPRRLGVRLKRVFRRDT